NQLALFYLLAFKAAGKLLDLQNLSSLIQQTIASNNFKLKDLAREFKYRDSVYFIGRGVEAQGNFLHSRRRNGGRGIEARNSRIDRKGNAGHSFES
ncbi:MAG TPA: hypothetical protein VJI71_01290, partial [Candidatus Norongarragalinales archaeon]|nr:hypothetical protein [Candidatus Norongarragalinales archaeon]